jgi:hypothetical protein
MKEKYNKIIKQINDAEKWLIQNNKRKDIQVFLDKFQGKLAEANEIIKYIEAILGREMTSQEILNGF